MDLKGQQKNTRFCHPHAAAMDLGGIARLERFLDTLEDPGSTDILFPHQQQQEQPIHSRKPRSVFHEFTIVSNGCSKKSVHFDGNDSKSCHAIMAE
jgi:hypothetical protein